MSEGRVGATPADEEEDLGSLARQTLAGVEASAVPPEPFALGVDLARLAASSRPSSVPAAPRAEDTDGRIDLRASSPGSVSAPLPATTMAASAAPSQSPAPTLVAAVRAPSQPFLRMGSQVLEGSPPQAAVARPAEPRSSTSLERELDDLIAARAFSPAAGLATSAGQLVAAARRAPSWTWVLGAGVAIGLAIGLALSGGDEAPAPAPIASSAPLPAASAAPPVLPNIASLPRPSAPEPQLGAHASKDRGSRRPASRPTEPLSRAELPVATAPAPTAAIGEPRSIDTLLDQALRGSGGSAQTGAAPERPASAGPSLPATPAREEVGRVLSALLPRVRFCGGGRSGVATAQIVAKSTGRISSVRIMGAPFSRTAAARCMETVIRGASFSSFSQSTFRVTYPYSL